MSEDQFNSVLDRVYQLEQTDLRRVVQNRAWFIIQFFILLVVILVIGYYFYQHLDNEMQEVKQTQARILSKLKELKKDNKLSAKIAAQIVNQIENDEQVRTAIKKVVTDNFQGIIEETPLTEEATEKSETVNEQVTDDSVKKDQAAPQSTINSEAASKFEAQGFTYLLAGEFDKAIEAFDKSENSYPTYHQVYEISRLLRKERANLDNPEKRKQIFQQIVNEMPYGAPPEMLDQLKKLANESGITLGSGMK